MTVFYQSMTGQQARQVTDYMLACQVTRTSQWQHTGKWGQKDKSLTNVAEHDWEEKQAM